MKKSSKDEKVIKEYPIPCKKCGNTFFEVLCIKKEKNKTINKLICINCYKVKYIHELQEV